MSACETPAAGARGAKPGGAEAVTRPVMHQLRFQCPSDVHGQELKEESLVHPQRMELSDDPERRGIGPARVARRSRTLDGISVTDYAAWDEGFLAWEGIPVAWAGGEKVREAEGCLHGPSGRVYPSCAAFPFSRYAPPTGGSPFLRRGTGSRSGAPIPETPPPDPRSRLRPARVRGLGNLARDGRVDGVPVMVALFGKGSMTPDGRPLRRFGHGMPGSARSVKRRCGIARSPRFERMNHTSAIPLPGILRGSIDVGLNGPTGVSS